MIERMDFTNKHLNLNEFSNEGKKMQMSRKLPPQKINS
jgi:hypothetical protein